DAIAGELVLQHLDLMADGDVQALHQILRRDALLDAVAAAVKAALPPAGEIKHGLAQRLAGDGARVQAGAADGRVHLDHGHVHAELGRLDGRQLTGRPAADGDVVELLHAPRLSLFSGNLTTTP